MTLQQFLDRLPGAARSGHDWLANCPGHDDRTASLSVTEKNGKILVFCHAGCEAKDVVAVLGLRMSDLFIAPNGHARAPDAPREIAAYPYCDEQGRVLYQVVRFEPKGFKQRRPD